MKVALIDNMNNCFFSFSRYLRDEGLDVHLYEVSDSAIYFTPKADTFKDTTSIEWIHSFPITLEAKNWLFLDRKKINKEFKQYDIIISAGLSSAYLEKANIKSDIIIPFGSDLYAIPFYRFEWFYSPKKLMQSILRANYAKYQMEAYLKSRVIAMYAGSRLYEDPLKRLRINWLDIHSPMLYNLEDTYSVDLKKIIEKKVLNKFENSDFVVFNHARHYWASNEDNLKDFDKYLGLKRNDRVIRAFASFLNSTQYEYPLLVLFEYGQDVKNSKKLVRDLNIENNVLWMLKSERKVIRILIERYCNIGTDQFREDISMGLSSVGYEVLSSGVPFVTHTSNMNDFFSKSPIIEALTSKDILDIFIDYEKNPEKYIDISQKSNEWFDKNLGFGLAKKYVKLIELLANNKTLTHNDEIIRDIFED